MSVLLTLDKSNFDVVRLPCDGCAIFVEHNGIELTSAACDLYADFDRNQLHAMRHLMGKLLGLVLERVNEEVTQTVQLHLNPKLWLVKIEVL